MTRKETISLIFLGSMLGYVIGRMTYRAELGLEFGLEQGIVVVVGLMLIAWNWPVLRRLWRSTPNAG